MALDKLVDSSQLDNGLTTIANAIRTKGGTSAQLSFPSGMAQAIAAIPSGGITPTGNIDITDTNVTDVTNYATAQVVDADLVASNIKKDVNILGIVGSFEGGGGSLPSSITKLDGGSFTLASDTAPTGLWISHNMGVVPKGFVIWTDDSDIRTASTLAVRTFVAGYCDLIGVSSGGVNYNVYQMMLNRTTNGVDNGSAGHVNSLSGHATNTQFRFQSQSFYYAQNIEYKWIAWA